MQKIEKIAVKEIINLLENKKLYLDNLQHQEAEKFINIPKTFALKGSKHDTNSCLLADASVFISEAISQLEGIDLK